MRTVTRSEMQEIDRRAITEYGIPGIILMENAGRRVYETALGMSKGKRQKAVIFSGSGNNGGDGWVVARHLINNGGDVEAFLIGDENSIKEDAKTNFSILKNMKVKIPPIKTPQDIARLEIPSLLSGAGIIIDAICGIGITREVREPARNIIELINRAKVPVLSVDIPSGLDADTGSPLGVAIEAETTVTMGLAKKGLVCGGGPRYTGRLIVADISLPREIHTLKFGKFRVL